MWILIIFILGFTAGVLFSRFLSRGYERTIASSALILLILGLLLATIRIVPAGHVGVVDFFGKVSPKPLQSGIRFVNPLARVINFSARTQEVKEIMNVPSKEGLNVSLDASILYHVDPPKAPELYKTVGQNYREILLIPQYRASARGVTVSYEAKALYTSEREILAQQMLEYLRNLVGKRGIVVERVLLRAITLPPTVSQAIEQKLKAEQEAERMKFVLQREQLEAERKRVEAAGIRDAQEIINRTLTPQYLQYLWINNLKENPNVIYVATEANLPLFRVAQEKKLTEPPKKE